MRREDKEAARAFIQESLRYSKMETMRGIYERLAPDSSSIIRSVMSPGGTETGRFNHSESFLEPSTNLANLPNKTAALDPLYEVRSVIVPHVGRLLGKADYSQAEARWCAWMAEDRLAMEQYAQEIDRYRFYVSHLKHGDDKHLHDVSKAERQSIGKVGILSCQYGVQWRTVQDAVNKDADLTGISIDAKTAKRMVGTFADLYGDTVRWWDRIRQEVLSRGYLVNPFGRRRDFFARRDSEAAEAALIREAIAFGPQSANADMLNTALRILYEKHDPRDLRLLLQVHDEIVFDCDPSDWSRIARLVKRVMEFPVEVNGRKLLIPAEVSVSATSWSKTRRVA